MILTCPKCATRYLVEDSEIRPEGRKVRCSACGDEWRVAGPAANQEDQPDGGQSEFDAEKAEGLEDTLTDQTEEVAEAPSAPALEPIRTEVEEALIVAPINTQSRTAAAPRSSLAANLGLFIILIAAIAVAAFSFWAEIVRFAPATSGVYRALGLAATGAPSAAPNATSASTSAASSAADAGNHD